MKQVFTLKSKPFSINATFYRGGYIKTSEWREWAANIFYQLNKEDNQIKLQQLRDQFDEKKHSIKVSIKVSYPKDIFITKQNVISAKTVDCSNFEKGIIDLIFDKRYFNEPFPNGCCNLNINDKNIISLYSSKNYHDKDYCIMNISVKIVPRIF